MDLCRDIDWGTLPEWVAAIATMLAFSWALFLCRRANLDKREEAARSVYAINVNWGNSPAGEPVKFDKNIHDIFMHSDVAENGWDESPVPTNPARLAPVLESPTLTYLASVVNGSNEVISKVKFEITSQSGRSFRQFEQSVDFVLPGETRTVALLVPHFKSKGLFTIEGVERAGVSVPG